MRQQSQLKFHVLVQFFIYFESDIMIHNVLILKQPVLIGNRTALGARSIFDSLKNRLSIGNRTALVTVCCAL